MTQFITDTVGVYEGGRIIAHLSNDGHGRWYIRLYRPDAPNDTGFAERGELKETALLCGPNGEQRGPYAGDDLDRTIFSLLAKGKES